MNYFKIKCRKTFLFVFCFFYGSFYYWCGIIVPMMLMKILLRIKMIRQLFLLRVVYL